MKKTPYLIATALLAIAAGTAVAQTGTPTATATPAAQRKPLDANQDGLIDRNEAAAHPRLATRFDELDKNKDGKLDSSERPHSSQGRRGHRGHGGAGRHVAALDKDNDGRISKAEAAAEPRFAERFAQMDVNKDGYVDGTDREVAAKQRRDEWFKTVDANNDGSLSKAELEAAHAKRTAEAGTRTRDKASRATPAQ